MLVPYPPTQVSDSKDSRTTLYNYTEILTHRLYFLFTTAPLVNREFYVQTYTVRMYILKGQRDTFF